MAKFCHNCGSPLEGAPKFCPSCGTPLMEVNAPPQQEMPMPQQEAPAPQQPPEQEMNPELQAPQEPPAMEKTPQEQPEQQQMPPQEQPGQQPSQPMQQTPQQMQGAFPPPPPKGPMAPPLQQMPPQSQQMPPQQQMYGQPQQMPRPQMQNPPMQRQMPQPPMMQGPQGQPMMYQNAPGQNFGQQPYGAWSGQGGQNAYGPQAEGAFTLGPLGTDQGLVQMFLRYDGRLNRKPYIFRALALFGVILVISILFAVLGTMMKSTAISMLGSLFSIVAAGPGVMLMIRRLHDLDHPTWWVVGGFIPLVNFALGLYLLCAEGTRGPNQFGPDPLEGQH